MSNKGKLYNSAKVFSDIALTTTDSNINDTISIYETTINKMKQQLSYDLFGRLQDNQNVPKLAFKRQGYTLGKYSKMNYFTQTFYLPKNKNKLTPYCLTDDSRISSSKMLTTQNSEMFRAGTKKSTAKGPNKQFTINSYNSNKSLPSDKTLINPAKNKTTLNLKSLSRNINAVQLLPTQETEIIELKNNAINATSERKSRNSKMLSPLKLGMSNNKEFLTSISSEYSYSEKIQKLFSKKFKKLNNSVKSLREKCKYEMNREKNDMIALMKEELLFFEKDSLTKKTKLHFNDYTFNAISKIKDHTAFKANSLLKLRVGLFNKYEPQDFKLSINTTSKNQHNIRYMVNALNLKKDEILLNDNNKGLNNNKGIRNNSIIVNKNKHNNTAVTIKHIKK
jgi:hypothetical protein